MIKVSTKGDFKNLTKFLRKITHRDPMPYLEKLGQAGVIALSQATPQDTGLTAASWYYEVEEVKDGYEVRWLNSNVNKGVNIAVLIQYGHGTNGGGFVQGVDYINPALADLFERAKIDIWKEVIG